MRCFALALGLSALMLASAIAAPANLANARMIDAKCNTNFALSIGRPGEPWQEIARQSRLKNPDCAKLINLGVKADLQREANGEIIP